MGGSGGGLGADSPAAFVCRSFAEATKGGAAPKFKSQKFQSCNFMTGNVKKCLLKIDIEAEAVFHFLQSRIFCRQVFKFFFIGIDALFGFGC